MQSLNGLEKTTLDLRLEVDKSFLILNIHSIMILNDTHYHEKTDPALAKVLENLRSKGNRVRIFYSDGYSECGRIGRSTGEARIPLLVHNTRSLGGPALQTQLITRVESSNKKYGKVVFYLKLPRSRL